MNPLKRASTRCMSLLVGTIFPEVSSESPCSQRYVYVSFSCFFSHLFGCHKHLIYIYICIDWVPLAFSLQVSMGGEGKIRVYFSTTSSSDKTRRDVNSLRTMLEIRKVHLRADFEPWIPVDVAMTSADLKVLFKKAGTNMLPMVFIDDKFVGGYDTLYELNETGGLDALLNMDNQTLVSEAQHAERMRGMIQTPYIDF